MSFQMSPQAARAGTREILHARMRRGSSNTGRGVPRFVDELVARVRRAGAIGPLSLRADSVSSVIPQHCATRVSSYVT